jgi:hypothetical protein
MNRIPTNARPPLINLTSEEKTQEKYRLVYSYINKQLKKHQYGSALINLKWGRIGDEGARIIADYLSSNPTLTNLTFCRTRFKDEAALDLVKILENNTTLTSLTFYTSRFDQAGFKAIAQNLVNNKALKILDLSDNNINNDIATTIAEFLKLNSNLTELSLSCNSITDDGAKLISEALKFNHTLRKLDLSRNSISDRDGSIISDIVRFNSTLTEINFCDINIQDESAIALAEVLKFNTSLTRLDLSKNLILSRGIKHIADALLSNQTLTEVKLSINIIDSDHFLELIRDFIKTIEILNFDINNEDGNYSNIENVTRLHYKADSAINRLAVKANNIENTDFLKAYLTIQKICNRNRQKELLINRATQVLTVLSPETPTEIADLLARELLITEIGAETLRRVGDLI